MPFRHCSILFFPSLDGDGKGQVDVSVLVLATGSWPLQGPSCEFTLPKPLVQFQVRQRSSFLVLKFFNCFFLQQDRFRCFLH